MNEKDDNARFTIRGEEPAADAIFIADAENLRIEKLSTRITLVAVLIPCLLVIILAIAYLDIKHRVINTQNTGSIGFQNLSKDLESRFSSLSLKQAKIEQQLAQTSKALETATAALQVNLKKSTAELRRLTEGKVGRAALAALAKQSETGLSDLKQDMAELNAALAKFDDELTTQILLMAEGLKKDQGRLADIEDRIQQLDAEKLNKASMELTLGIERLALQEMVKDKIRAFEKKLVLIDKKIDVLTKRMDASRQPVPRPAPTSAAPAPPPPQTPANASTIVEQTID
ncbi:MAG: hypothetical protein PVG51_13110 [Desulfosarcina sp.]|jgi:hypothetical protein